MLLGFMTVVLMLGVGYAYLREGMLTAFSMLFSVLISGLLAFNFWEPLAEILEPQLANMFLEGCEDFFSLLVLFVVPLGILRTLANYLVPSMIGFPMALQRSGGFLFGMLAGYFAFGFMVCMFQTLPWHQNFMNFEYRYDGQATGLRKLLPPDRVWLAMMARAGAYPFANDLDERAKDPQNPYDTYLTFDRDSTFELRYARYRRYDDAGRTTAYGGEFDAEIYKRR